MTSYAFAHTIAKGLKIVKISTLKDYDIIILCLQETWVQEHEVNKLSSIKSGYVAVSVSGIDNTKILQGRPYGSRGEWPCIF